MRNALSSIDLDSDFDVNMGSSIRGRKAFIADISEEAMIMFRGLEAGIVVCGVITLVNVYRVNKKKNPISCSAVQRFTLSSSFINESKRMNCVGLRTFKSMYLIERKNSIGYRRGGRDLPAAIVEERVEQFLFQEATEDEEDDIGDNEDKEKEVV